MLSKPLQKILGLLFLLFSTGFAVFYPLTNLM